MNRGVITISESGTVSMPTDTVWMTMQEIADMYNVFGCYVRKAVKAIFKDGILKEQGVRWKSHSTLTLLATQDLPTFLYYMIDPLKSWCWGAILFYPFKNSRFS